MEHSHIAQVLMAQVAGSDCEPERERAQARAVAPRPLESGAGEARPSVTVRPQAVGPSFKFIFT